MPKPKTIFVCSACGYESPRWYGKCPSCESWNTLEETAPQAVSAIAPKPQKQRGGTGAQAQKIYEIEAGAQTHEPTGIGEFDRVLGGGIVEGSLMLVGGVVALLGLIRLVMAFTGKRPVYGPTGETLTRKELFFEAQDRQALLAAFQAGDMEKIERIPHGHSSNVLLMIYTTPSGSCTLAQVQEYVPHEFVAVTDVARFSQAAVKEPQTAAKNVAVSA